MSGMNGIDVPYKYDNGHKWLKWYVDMRGHKRSIKCPRCGEPAEMARDPSEEELKEEYERLEKMP